MKKKYDLLLATLQLLVGILATIVLIRNLMTGGRMELTIFAALGMLAGFASGVRSLRKYKEQ